ncbi:hypothetical protein NQD34_014008 [Periophthalmus magnuspinnatus]|nr:hypothetical protein NQD34_014008 [Periophthalmus magnuspinnatus]
MDASFVLAAVIFTLLAIVVATSMFTGTSPSSDYGRRAAGRVTEEESASPGKHNGHGPCSAPEPQPRKTAEFDWTEMSGSSHDHWDVVKNVQSVSKTCRWTLVTSSAEILTCCSVRVQEEEQLSTDLSRPPSSSSSGRGSYINLSDSELLKCAFPLSQTEGATESTDHRGRFNILDSNSSSFRYLPGKSRSHHFQMMMSKDELEEEQRVQRQQLAAIFQLLKNNQDTFGEVSQNDMDEQLKLYSI